MWSWFGGGGAAAKKDVTKEAILNLRSQLEMLQKKEKHLEQLVADQDAIARKMVQVNKQAAMAALKRKSMHQGHLSSTQAQIQTVEKQMHTVETANLNFETLKVMQSSSDAMKHLHNGLSLDKLDDTMEEVREQQQVADEIARLLSSLGEASNEEELETELELLKQQQLDHTILGAPAAPITATPQTTKDNQIEEDEDTELTKLRAEMAM